jgi:hypothetical protein
MLDTVSMVIQEARVFEHLHCGATVEASQIHETSSGTSEAAALVRSLTLESDLDPNSAPVTGPTFRRRDWQQRYLTALVRGFEANIDHPIPATVVFGTAPLIQTSSYLTDTEGLIFFDVREMALVSTLSQRLRRQVDLMYGQEPKKSTSCESVFDGPDQVYFQVLGLVAFFALESLLESLSGRTSETVSTMEAAGYLADRLNDGLQSLLLVTDAVDRPPQDRYPAWDPTTAAFILGHEFGHLFLKGGFNGGMKREPLLDHNGFTP